MTIRSRTTLAATIVVGIALVVAAFGLVVLQRRSLVQHLDEVIDLRANDIAALAREAPLPRSLETATDDDEQVIAIDADGHVVAESPGPAVIRPFEPAGEDAIFRSIDGWRVAARTVEGDQGPLTIYVSASLEPVDESIALLTISLGIGGPVLLALVAFTTWVLVGRTLRPVESIRHEVATISEQSLSRRVPVPSTGDEIERLASTMNSMLDRLEQSAERQHRFVADASHELRTPLAAMRADLELRGDSELLQTTLRMERLVNNLLYLARVDAVAVEGSLLDLDDIVLDEIAAHRGRVPVDTTALSGAAVRGRRDDLARVVRNLIDNADHHAASRVAVSLVADTHHVTMTVADDGLGIPAADRERVFERFTRLDDARDRAAGGTGLGLAIAREVVVAHGGAIAATDDGIVVTLPLA